MTEIEVLREALTKIRAKAGSHTVSEQVIIVGEADPGFAGIYAVADAALSAVRGEAPWWGAPEHERNRMLDEIVSLKAENRTLRNAGVNLLEQAAAVRGEAEPEAWLYRHHDDPPGLWDLSFTNPQKFTDQRGLATRPLYAAPPAPVRGEAIEWTADREAARVALCHFWIKIADDPECGYEWGKRARETEQALTILGEIARNNGATAAAVRGEAEPVIDTRISQETRDALAAVDRAMRPPAPVRGEAEPGQLEWLHRHLNGTQVWMPQQVWMGRSSAISRVATAASPPAPAPVGVTEALQSLSNEIEMESAKLGALDGYSYDSGVEFGLRLAMIKIDEALASPAPAPVGVTEQLREIHRREGDKLGELLAKKHIGADWQGGKCEGLAIAIAALAPAKKEAGE